MVGWGGGGMEGVVEQPFRNFKTIKVKKTLRVPRSRPHSSDVGSTLFSSIGLKGKVKHCLYTPD